MALLVSSAPAYASRSVGAEKLTVAVLSLTSAESPVGELGVPITEDRTVGTLFAAPTIAISILNRRELTV